jgi:hypothetical protein
MKTDRAENKINNYLSHFIIIMRGENFMAHVDGLSSTPVSRGTPVAHHCSISLHLSLIFLKNFTHSIHP